MTDGEEAGIILVMAGDEGAACDSLREDGLQVVSVADPTAALDAVRAAPAGFALLLAESGAAAGLELARKVRDRAPRLRMLFVVSDDSAERARLWDYGTVLSKPYSPDELLTLVRRDLGKS